MFLSAAAGVEIESLYCKSAELRSEEGSIRVNQLHGSLQAFSTDGDISVNSCNGLMDLKTLRGSLIAFHVHQMPAMGPSSTGRHSRPWYSILAPNGSIAASIDKQVR